MLLAAARETEHMAEDLKPMAQFLKLAATDGKLSPEDIAALRAQAIEKGRAEIKRLGGVLTDAVEAELSAAVERAVARGKGTP